MIDEADRIELRPLLVRLLRRDGYGAVCRNEPRSHIDTGNRLSWWVMTALTGGFTSCLSDWTNATTWGWVGLLIATLAVLLAITALKTPQTGATILLLAWTVTLVVQLSAGDREDAWVTHGLPFAITALAVWIAGGQRLRTVAQVSPLLLPVTLTVLLLPLFTDNLWEAAAQLTSRQFVALGAMTVIPLLFFLHRRLGPEINVSVRHAAESILADRDAVAARLADRLERLVEERDRDRARQVVREPVQALYGSGVTSEHVEVVATRIRRSLRRRLSGRLLWTALSLAAAVTIYIYLLAWVLVPIKVARDWADATIATESVDLILVTAHIPTGPFVAVAGLLGIIATAVLLAFVLTEEHYASNLTEAVLRSPIRDGVESALPYVALSSTDADGGAK